MINFKSLQVLFDGFALIIKRGQVLESNIDLNTALLALVLTGQPHSMRAIFVNLVHFIVTHGPVSCLDTCCSF